MRPIVYLGLVLFSANLIVRCLDPLVPEIAKSTNVSIDVAAGLSTALALSYAIVQPVLGMVGDAFGKNRVMIVGGALIAGASFAGAIAPNYSALLFSRIATGFAAGAILPVSLAIATDLVPAERVQESLGRLTGTALTSNLLGSLMSASLSEYVGWRGVLWIGAFLLIITMAVSTYPILKINQTRVTPSLGFFYRTAEDIIRNPNSAICFSLVFCEGVIVWGLFPYIGHFMLQQGEHRVWTTGVVIGCFGAGGILYALTVGRMTRRLSPKQMIHLGSTLVAITLIVFGFQLTWWFLSLTFLITGTSFYMLHGSIQRKVVDLAPNARGTSVAFYSTFFYFGQAFGPIAYGFTVAHVGRLSALVAGGLAMALCAQIASFFFRTTDEHN